MIADQSMADAMKSLRGQLGSALIVIAALRSVFAQCYSLGKCPRHAYIRDFNQTRFLGHWYEVERSFHIMELLSTCTTLDLRQAASKPQVSVTVRTLNKWTGSLNHIEFIANTSRRHPSVFLFKRVTRWPHALAKLLPGFGLYQVLRTDYDQYAIVWTCTQAFFGLAYNDLIWVFGRHLDIDAHLRLHIYDILKSLNIDSDRFTLANNHCTAAD